MCFSEPRDPLYWPWSNSVNKFKMRKFKNIMNKLNNIKSANWEDKFYVNILRFLSLNSI